MLESLTASDPERTFEFEFGERDGCRRAYVLLADVCVYEGHRPPLAQKRVDQELAVTAFAAVGCANDQDPPPALAEDALGHAGISNAHNHIRANVHLQQQQQWEQWEKQW